MTQQDLGYGQTQDLMSLLEEVSRVLTTYTRTLLAPDFRIRAQRDIKGEALG